MSEESGSFSRHAIALMKLLVRTNDIRISELQEDLIAVLRIIYDHKDS